MDIVKIGKFIGALHRRFQTAMSHELNLPEINASNSNFLLLINENDRITAKQITTELAINKGLVSREMNHLENAGYIMRTPDDNDHRTTWITVTPKGVEACKIIRQLKEELWNQILADTGTTDADLKTVFTQLESWSEAAKNFK